MKRDRLPVPRVLVKVWLFSLLSKTLQYLIIREASRRNEVDPVPADSSVVTAVIPTSLFSGKLPVLVLTALSDGFKRV